MASRPDLRLLLGGQYSTVEFDRNRNGHFEILNVLVPFQVLSFFSTTAKTQYRNLGQALYAQPIDNQISHALPIKLVGGTAQGHRDVLDWMNACCAANQILDFEEHTVWPVRHVLAMTSIKVMGIFLLEHEILRTILRLRSELIRPDQIERIFAYLPDGAMPEICAAIAVNVANKFCNKQLPGVEKHFELARNDYLYSQGVANALDELRKENTIRGAWQACSAWKNRSLIGYRAMRTQVEPGYSFASLPYRPLANPHQRPERQPEATDETAYPTAPRFTAFYTRPSVVLERIQATEGRLIGNLQALSEITVLPTIPEDRATGQNDPAPTPVCPVCEALSPHTVFEAHQQQGIHRMFGVRGHECAPRRRD